MARKKDESSNEEWLRLQAEAAQKGVNELLDRQRKRGVII